MKKYIGLSMRILMFTLFSRLQYAFDWVSVQSSANYRHDYLLDTFWERYHEHITIAAVLLTIGAVYAVYNHRRHKRQFLLLKASEMVLRNITNNINGGVLVLNPQKEYQISYVNEGFLKLLGYTKDEIYGLSPKNYIQFIHLEDQMEFKKLIKPANYFKERENDLSVQLRIRKKAGTYLTTLVKGSFVINEQGKKELFCVVMDISRERAMMDELEFDRERHKILLEQSDEILFEINYNEQTVKVSQKFKEKFGWSLPRRYWGDREPDLLNVYYEDRAQFAKELTEIYGGKLDGELITRLCKKDGTPCWCKIIYHLMKIDDNNMRLIGKITDIDEEMKEKQALLQKVQMDALTGLYNKDAFRDISTEYLENNKSVNNAVVFFDVDNFKDINDTLGHPMGDRALRDVSHKMKLIFSSRDILGRFGGDEFCVLVKNISEKELRKTLDSLLEELRLEYGSRFLKVSVSVSIGAVCTEEFGNDFEKLLEYADKAQYYAKEMGKNSYAIYNNELRLKGYEGRKPTSAD
ncbi:MAG: diguanylate cyclase [Oscillospiraceae bacterium]|nr:diguanylate cyclase [Oscillospiraceae bacterium]